MLKSREASSLLFGHMFTAVDFPTCRILHLESFRGRGCGEVRLSPFARIKMKISIQLEILPDEVLLATELMQTLRQGSLLHNHLVIAHSG